MAIFGKQFRNAGRQDEKARLAALEEHIRYMQEQLEFFGRQTEKRMGELEKRT